MPKPDSAPDGSPKPDSVRPFLWRLTKEVVTTLVFVAIIAGILFAYTGIWPPFVSVISGSMEPNLERSDLVLIMDTDRVDSPDKYSHGDIIPHNRGDEANVNTFGKQGHVIIFTPNSSNSNYNIIHRAMFYVEKGEDWSDRANPDYVPSTECARLEYCPAPHDGFITKGDANAEYDQTSDISGPVPVKNVKGIAQFKIPFVGRLHLLIEDI